MTGADVANVAVVVGLIVLAAVIYRAWLRPPVTTRVTVIPAELTEADEESRPVDGGSMAPQSLASGLLREKGRADKLAAVVAELTAANQACTCAGGDPE